MKATYDEPPMPWNTTEFAPDHSLDLNRSNAAKQRLFSLKHEPLFIADWDKALMIHYRVDAQELQGVVPFELDLWEGNAYVSLVAFTMRGMRPRFGGRWTGWLFHPIATHDFLNLRTYVRCGGERGIYFITEWLENRLSLLLGPRTFGLPYRYAAIQYRHESAKGFLEGQVVDPSGLAFRYRGTVDQSGTPSPPDAGSFAEFLMEHYTAFTAARGPRRFFRVWHLPWLQRTANVEITDTSLIERHWNFFGGARTIGANYSAGLKNVWMGWPHGIEKLGTLR